jgi:hypothetical protein
LTLNHFFEPKKRGSLKAAFRRMRSIWLKGPVDHFDKKLAKILDSSLEHAATVSESWLNMGFLCYNKQGLLTWRTGGF